MMPHTLSIGDFIEIPTWRVWGCVINVRPALFGPEDTQEVLLEREPDDPNPRWYRVLPSEFERID
jgi:hypothetical protein